MKPYLGVSSVAAVPMTRIEYNTLRGWTVPADENPDDTGFLVERKDGVPGNHPAYKGYISWLPSEAFHATYSEVGKGAAFGAAIEWLRSGLWVRRIGWPKDVYLWLLPSADIKAEWCRERHLKALAEEAGGSIKGLASIRMLTSDGQILTGWTPSQEDLFATDWAPIVAEI